jgi:flagellar assembly protein FliH
MSQKVVSVDDEVPFEAWVLPDVSKTESRGAALAHRVIPPNTAKPHQDPNVTVADEELSPERITVSEIENIREQAHLEGYEAGREAGHEVGVKEGHQEGYDAGLKQAEQEIAERLAKLDALMAAMAEPMNVHQQRLAEAAALTGIKVAEAVLPHAAKQSPEALVPVVKEALACLPDKPGQITIKVHPADQATLQMVLQEMDTPATLVPSESVTQGGCFVKADATQIDAYLETRLDQVVSELKERIALAMNTPSEEAATPPEDHADESAD